MMADMTMAEALNLAKQDSPLPYLAGQALKLLRDNPPARAWRPIDSAPRDGTSIVGLNPDFIGAEKYVSPCHVVRFDRGAWRYANGEYTHSAAFWLPIADFAHLQADAG